MTIVDIAENNGEKIAKFTKSGIRIKDGRIYEADVSALTIYRSILPPVK